MKLSAWHKSKGDFVEWYDNDNPSSCDILYCSKTFTDEWTKDCADTTKAKEVIKGGTGYGGVEKLPPEIEHIYPDYSLYPHLKDTAVGFLTRGCPNGCGFCGVKRWEGLKSQKVADLSNFWNGQKNIILYDPNILACKECVPLLQQLADARYIKHLKKGDKHLKPIIKFQQGLDARLITERTLPLLRQLKIKEWYFAWDLEKFGERIKKGLLLWRQAYPEIRQADVKVYMLVNYNTTKEYDLERCEWLEQNGFYPYVMVYERWNADKWYTRLQSYYNNPILFFSKNRKPFHEFNPSDRYTYSSVKKQTIENMGEKKC